MRGTTGRPLARTGGLTDGPPMSQLPIAGARDNYNLSTYVILNQKLQCLGLQSARHLTLAAL